MSTLDFRQKDDALLIVPHGKLDVGTVGRFWDRTCKMIEANNPLRIVVDGSDVSSCDGAGIAFLLYIKQKQDQQQRSFSLEGFREELLELIQANSLEGLAALPPGRPSFRRVAHEVGKAGYRIGSDLRQQVGFLGEVVYHLVCTLTHPRRLRWRDMFLIAEKAGANAIGIIALLGFLIGLILAFQSAVPMRQFGAQIYVADLVVICMFRELGPLITAFILASRSGSAFAAELGTMRVNEELDALKTFGMDPMRFMVVPRVLALILVIPVLTLIINLFGLLGSELVLRGLGFSSVVYWDRVTSASGLMDLFGGLAKTLVFGFLIGAIGCLRGIQAGKGASAVGDAATRAVVTSIITVVVVDFVFAIVYYLLGI